MSARRNLIRSYGSQSVALLLASLAVWSVFAAGAGVVWMIRDGKYVNDVLIPTVVLALAMALILIRVARRLWIRSRSR